LLQFGSLANQRVISRARKVPANINYKLAVLQSS